MRSVLFGRAARFAAILAALAACSPQPTQSCTYGASGCQPGGGSTPTTRVAISPDSASIQDTDSLRLLARFYRDNAVDSSVAITWSTRDANIATIGINGVVLGVGSGTTRVIARGGGAADSAVVTVALRPVAGVTVQPSSATVDTGASFQFSALVVDAKGRTLSGRAVAWSSSDLTIATVSSSGLVRSIKSGSVTVTATSEGKNGAASLTVASTPPPVANVAIQPSSAGVDVGKTLQLGAMLTDASGSVLSGRQVTWSTSSASIATVSSGGLVSGIGAGTATITATSEGKSGTASITVNVPPAPVATVTVSPAPASVTVGQSIQLQATLRDSANNVLMGRTVAWASSNVSLATVSSTGLVQGVAAGTVTVTATSEGKSGSSAVTVAAAAPAPVATVVVSPSSANLSTGQSVALQVTLRDASNNVLTGRTVTWASSNAAVATVSSTGVVQGVAAGSATATATSEGKSGSSSITVTSSTTTSVAELPRSYLDTHYAPPTGNTISVPAGGNLQAALNNAQPCDVIVLQAGATFTGTYTLPNKSGSCWITIRSSAADASLPAEGARMTPAYASLLPKIVSTGNTAALQTAAGAHNYRIMFVEMTVATNVTTNYGIVALGDGSGAQSSLSVVPTNLILDRVYVHGHSTLNTSRCVALNSASTAVIDSYLSECHASGFDSQAIGGWNGPGPFKIVDDYLEGSGENIMFGGADPKIANLTPSDIEIRHNHFTRPTSWKGVWTVKNLFELKNAQRVLVEGNIFENHWPDAQAGDAILMKSVNQDGTAPWSVTRDVTFRYNHVRNVSGGINLAAHPEASPVVPMSNILISNNLLENVNVGVFTGPGRLLEILNGPANMTIEHNTLLNSDASNAAVMMDVTPPQMASFVFRNNIMSHGQYGFEGSGAGSGTAALNYYAAPGWIFQGNVIYGVSASQYPSGNGYPATSTLIGFVDFTGGNYRLLATSPYAKQATDGADPGADLDTIDRLTQGVVIP
ncbi:MAG TPA: Ig-like domain-containing protein [Gemmatimonadaceae bacterium]